MNEMTFKKNMNFLQKYLRYTLSEQVFVLFWSMLKHLPDEKFNLACRNIVKEFIPTIQNPFPLVSHFLQHCAESGDTQAFAQFAMLKQAIRRVGQYESVDLGDPYLHFAINSVGGWVSICTWTDQEWDINERKLIETYKAAQAAGFKDNTHLIGLAEQEHGAYRLYTYRNGTLISDNRFTPFLQRTPVDKIDQFDDKFDLIHNTIEKITHETAEQNIKGTQEDQ